MKLKLIRSSFYSVIIYLTVVLSTPAAFFGIPDALADSNDNKIKTDINDSFNSIRIIRDEFGVAHIYAKNIFDLYFGYGYITAEDRLFQIEILRRSVSGKISEIFGAKYIELDKSALRDGYSCAEIEERIARLHPLYVKILEQFAAGINKKIKEIEKNPGKLPIEFKKFGFQPASWSRADVASIYIGTMAVRYSDFSSEMDNMALLKTLSAKFGEKKAFEIFDDIVPLNDHNSPATITCDPCCRCGSTNETDGTKYNFPAENNFKNSLKIKNNAAALLNARMASETFERAARLKKQRMNNAAALASIGLPVKLGSYTYLISGRRSASGAALIASGPQMGFFNPAYLIEVGLHSPEIDITGTTTPCYMNIMFGMNRYIAFTATAGVGNLTDVYEHKLNPVNHNEYFYKNHYEKFKKRHFEIKVKGRKKPLKVKFLRSVYGPVFEIDEKAGLAYSKKRAWEGLELESMFEWMNAVNSKNFGELKFYFSRNPISINIMAINRGGEHYHYLSGFYPIRNGAFDDRLPLPGDGSADWNGFEPPCNNPCSRNETEGFIANWNSKPLPDFRNGDLSTQWGPDQRTALIQNYLRKKEKIDMHTLHELHEIIGYTDLRAYIFMPLILKYIDIKNISAKNPSVRTISKILKNWNGLLRDDDKNGRYDNPGAAVFDSLWRTLMDSLFKDELAGMLWTIESETFWTQSLPLYYTLTDNINGVQKLNHDYTNGLGLETILTKACEIVFKKLSEEYKTKDTSRWLQPARKLIFETNNFLGVPQTENTRAIEMLMINRGTENHFIELGKNYTFAYNLNPPGQSGYRAVNPIYDSKHTQDQLDLFIDYKGYKPMHFDITEIIKNKTSEKFIFKN